MLRKLRECAVMVLGKDESDDESEDENCKTPSATNHSARVSFLSLEDKPCCLVITTHFIE